MTVGRVIALAIAQFRVWRHRGSTPASLRVTPPDQARPSVPAAYMPLYTYLERRYAVTVVLTFEQIESLLGFALPSLAFADTEWWTGPSEANARHSAAWLAARRSAAPRLSARIVTFGPSTIAETEGPRSAPVAGDVRSMAYDSGFKLS
jgi:hypothetical protein